MTNRFFCSLPILNRTTRICETSFCLCSDEYSELSEDFDGALLLLEQQHSDEILTPHVQETESNYDDVSLDDAIAPCCFDAAGLQEDFEIDVRWI